MGEIVSEGVLTPLDFVVQHMNFLYINMFLIKLIIALSYILIGKSSSLKILILINIIIN